ncbi:MAG: STAS domain-containing protein [Lachnospiraceae bacterium]|nr:STAS domain-containing protein [Lachnospiraceae bacterium]
MEEFRVIDNCLMIRLPEEVDHHRSAYIGEKADRFILNKEVKHVVFDFGDTKFMDSSGIGIIVGRYKKISCFGGRVYIIHADKQIRRILRMSGLEQIVEIMERQEK